MKVFSPKVVLFLHAFPLSKDMYIYQFRKLEEKGLPFVALDYPGFGDEPPPLGDVSIESLTDFVVFKLRSLGVREVVAIGDSMGGYIMFDLFRRYRTLLRGLVFVATRAEADPPEAKKLRYETIERVKKEGKAFLIETMLENQTSPATKRDTSKMAFLRTLMEKATEEGIVKTLKALAERRDNTDLLSQIDVPTLVIAGKDDEKVTPPQVVKKIAQGIKGSVYYELENSAHLPPFENPKAFNEVLEKFLKEIF